MSTDSSALGQQPAFNPRNSIARRGGRPSKFELEMIPKIRKASKAGMTELEIADLLDVEYNTFISWQVKHPKILQALELGRKQATKRVVRALFHRSVGYSHDQERVFNDKGTIIKATQREHIPPDVNAIKFWLTNKAPAEWQDRTGLDVTGNISIVAQTLSVARQRLLAAKSTLPTLEGDSGDITEIPDADSE